MSTGGIRATVICAVICAGAALSAVLLTACGGAGMVGSGTAAAQTRHPGAFSSVDLTGSSHVAIHAGGSQSVVVHADDNLLGQVTTQVHASTLMIGTRGSFTTSTPMSVQISVPSLEAVTLSGSGAITAGNIQAPRLSVRLSGSGVVRASGTVTRLDVSLGGSGDVQLEQLVARDVHAVLAGSGRIVTHATNTLQASVPGSGTIVYSGNPAHVTTSITGSGAITRR
jgi:Putative auto-transporter adhesin, head GIN domain